MYEWIKWFHIISLISWFSALFYLPRLFVYHMEHIENKGFVDVVKIQEMKLFKYIGIPAMWATILSGFMLIYIIGLDGGWLYTKLFLITLLIIYFYSLNRYRLILLQDKCKKSGKFFRFYNEVPTILMLLIVAMVILKPF